MHFRNTELDGAALQEREDLVGDQVGVQREGEMTGINELDLRRRHEALEAFGALGDEGLQRSAGAARRATYGIALAPDGEDRRLVGLHVLVQARVEREIVAICRISVSASSSDAQS